MDSTTHFPVIDFGLFVDGNPEDRVRVAHQVDEAFRTYGFLYLANHGISQPAIDEAFEQAKRFHGLPLDAKLRLAKSSRLLGYSALRSEIIRGMPSLKESIGLSNPQDASTSTQWPVQAEVPGFKEKMLDFHESCTALAYRFLSCLSLALELPPSCLLEKYHKQSSFTLDLIRYPSIGSEALRAEAQARLSAHSDFGTVTLLFQEDGSDIEAPGGLEAAVIGSSKEGTSASYDATGTWFDVAPIRGTVLVNVGYCLKRWTNSRWKSLVHRVGVPPKLRWASEKDGAEHDVTLPERFSMPFFVLPDQDTLIEALPGMWSMKNPRKWPPLDLKEYVRKKRDDLHPGLKAETWKHEIL